MIEIFIAFAVGAVVSGSVVYKWEDIFLFPPGKENRRLRRKESRQNYPF